MRLSTAVADARKSSGKAWYTALPYYALALLGLLALDALAFRTPFYRHYLEPQSYAGTVEQMLLRVGQTAAPQRVIVLGDSRIAEGFSAKLARQRAADDSVQFVNAAVPGSTPRCWSYFLRWMPPALLRGAVVVIPVDDYADEDGAWDWADRSLDNSVVAARLSLAELPEYVASFRGFQAKLQAVIAGTLRGSALRQDVQSFLAAPARRIENINTARTHGAEWLYNYTGNSADLRGLEVDWAARRITFPASLSAPQKEALRASAFRERLPQTGRYKEYRSLWFRKMLSYLRSQGAQAVIVRVPRGPIPAPHANQPADTALSAIAQERLATLAPEGQFSSIERPACFFDDLHLNSVGREEFTIGLVDYLIAIGAIHKEQP